MRKLRVLDLFSGIGGFSLGLERTGGFETVAFCEIEPYPRAVLKKHWPKVPCYEDVRTLTADALARDGIAVDVICGGFPCQDISFAGKGAGLAGERSGLWREYARLIGEFRPCFVIVENVAALLGRGLGSVLGDLAALGYDAEWHCIPASAVGAPHRRDRLWLVAYAKHHGSLGAQIATGLRTSQKERWMQQLEGLVAVQDAADAEAMHGATLKRGEQNGDHERSEAVAYSDKLAGNQGRQSNAKKRQGRRNLDRGRIGSECVADAELSGCQRRNEEWGRAGSAMPSSWWLTEPDVGRVAHGVPSRVDRLKGLGNAVVPQIPELIGRAILQAEGMSP